MAAENGYLDILQWLAQRNPPILPDVDGANLAAENGYLDILQWLMQRKFIQFYLT